MDKEIKLKPIPDVGKTYKFYDDGKIRPTRQYDATVLRLVSVKEAKKIEIHTSNETKTLYEFWKGEVDDHIMDEDGVMYHVDSDGNLIEIKAGESWLYAIDTDWFIECSIPGYDENTIWFVRTIYGEWFSIDIQNGWQSGKLDVTGELTELLEE